MARIRVGLPGIPARDEPERAIEILLERLESAPPERPAFDERPDLAPKILFRDG